jgi:hypothetical protein
MMPIYIGYDSREDIAYTVLEKSLRFNIKHGVFTEDIKKLDLNLAKKHGYNRPYTIIKNNDSVQKIDTLTGECFSTEFSYSRFLIPKIMNYQGYAMFMDCDFLALKPISNLWLEYSKKWKEEKAIWVCKLNYTPNSVSKMDNQIQTLYPKKLWSSLIIWNCSHPKNSILNSEVVNKSTGAYLHQFQWLEEDDIGFLDLQWNWIPNHSTGEVGFVHFTEGGPWFENYKDVPYAEAWRFYNENFKTKIP